MILVASCQRAFIFACRVLLAPGFWLTTETAAKTSFGGFVLMHKNMSRILQTIAGAAMGTALMAVAQTAAPAPAAPAATAAAAPAAPAASPTWSVGPMDISGFIDGYYSYNLNTPAGQLNDLYNFNDKTAQFSLNAAKLTLNHDADPIGARVDLIFGNTDRLMNGSNGDTKYIEQAYLELKPAKAKGFEFDFGKFVTSAGAEVIETKDNWNYSRSLLFSWAIPYYHIGARMSMPVSKTDTVGVQITNGWNGGNGNNAPTIGVTNALVKTKYTWNANYYGGPGNSGTTTGARHLLDTTLLLTPCSKFNAYVNYDYGQNRDALSSQGDKNLNHWQGVAVAARGQVSGTSALVGRYEYFKDYQGYSTGTKQNLQEFTATYEYKWVEGLVSRAEYRYDKSNQKTFNKDTENYTDNQSTFTVGFVAFFGPKR